MEDPKYPIAKYPWRDIYQNLPHNKHATHAKAFLAFKAPKFREEHPVAWEVMVADLNEDSLPACYKAMWQQCCKAVAERRSAQFRSAGSAPSRGHEADVSDAGAYGSSTFVAGLSAAQLKIAASGQACTFFDSMSDAQLLQINMLLLRWLNAKALPMSALDCEEWLDVIKLLRPAAAGKTLTYDMIRCVAQLRRVARRIARTLRAARAARLLAAAAADDGGGGRNAQRARVGAPRAPCRGARALRAAH